MDPQQYRSKSRRSSSRRKNDPTTSSARFSSSSRNTTDYKAYVNETPEPSKEATEPLHDTIHHHEQQQYDRQQQDWHQQYQSRISRQHNAATESGAPYDSMYLSDHNPTEDVQYEESNYGEGTQEPMTEPTNDDMIIQQYQPRQLEREEQQQQKQQPEFGWRQQQEQQQHRQQQQKIEWEQQPQQQQQQEGKQQQLQEREQQQEPEPRKLSFFEQVRSPTLRPFIIISSSYLLFTITDGAIRMIVLLHAYSKQFTALEVSVMFTLYELAGVGTNLAAGILGAKWGIRYTLISGLALQLLSYGLLFFWNDNWSKMQSIIYVTIAQMFAGIAKDLTKLGGKTVTKLVTPDEKESQLFKLVSLLTGWKNSLKGVGYFAGSALVQVSYNIALTTMMGLVLLAMPWAMFGLSNQIGRAKSTSATWSEIFCLDNPNLNILSIARLFLFAGRDFWFEVPLPFFLRSPQCEGLGPEYPCTVTSDCVAGAICNAVDAFNTTTTATAASDSGFCESINIGGGCGGLGMQRVIVGAFLGGYIILYGQIQSWTPQLVTGPLQQTPPNKYTEVLWGLVNCIPTLVAAFVMQFADQFTVEGYDLSFMTIFLIIVIVTFAIIFAINSSIHSFLVVNYAAKEKVAVSVGLYYMSNALGRLMGTIGSGLLYTYVGEEINAYTGPLAVQGLMACFYASTACSLLAALITMKINDNKAGLNCGSCWTIVQPQNPDHDDNGNNYNDHIDKAIDNEDTNRDTVDESRQISTLDDVGNKLDAIMNSLSTAKQLENSIQNKNDDDQDTYNTSNASNRNVPNIVQNTVVRNNHGNNINTNNNNHEIQRYNIIHIADGNTTIIRNDNQKNNSQQSQLQRQSPQVNVNITMANNGTSSSQSSHSLDNNYYQYNYDSTPPQRQQNQLTTPNVQVNMFFL